MASSGRVSCRPFVDINWLYFGFLPFMFTCVPIFAVGIFTEKASREQLAGLTYGSVTKDQDAATRASFGFWEIFHTAVVLAIIAAIYLSSGSSSRLARASAPRGVFP
jgi:solute:Na+ symporter, SSS family